MTVVVDNTGASTGGLSATTLTISSFAVGAGAERCIYLGVSQYKNPDATPTATFNGSENFVVHDAVTIGEGAGTRRVTLFKLVNPSNVTANIVVTWATAVDEAVIGATSWTGVDQTTPFGTAVKNSGTGASSSINLSGATGDVNHDALSADAAGTPFATANQTARWRTVASGTGTTEGDGQTSAGTGSAVTHTWSTLGGGGSTVFAHIGVAIQQSSGAAVSTPAPMLSVAMRPTPKGLRGQVAMAMRAIKPRTFDAAPSVAGASAASLAMSTAFAIGVAIFSGTGTSTAQSTAQAPATGIAAGAGLSVSQATGSAASASTGAGSGASTAPSLARGTGAPTGAGGGCTTAQSTSVAVGSPSGAGVGISSGGGALCIAIGQAVVPGVGGVTVAQSTIVGTGAPIGAGGGCTTSVSTARATSAPTGAGAGTSSSQSRAVAIGAATSAAAGISVSQSTAIAAQGADIPTVEAAGLVLIPNDGRLSLTPNNGQLVLTPNNGALSLVPNNGALSLIPDQ